MKKIFRRIIIFVVILLSIFFGIIKPLDAIIIIELLFIILSTLGLFLTYTSGKVMFFSSSIGKKIIATIFVLVFTVTALDFALELISKNLLKNPINSLYLHIASISIPVLSIILGFINGHMCKNNT